MGKPTCNHSRGCRRQAKYSNGLCGACYELDRKAGLIRPKCRRCADDVPFRYRFCDPCARQVKADQRDRYATERKARKRAAAKCPRCKAVPARFSAAKNGRPKLCGACEAYHRRDVVLRHRYGITVEAYDALLAAQGGTCAICPATEPGNGNANLFVDHCHATGAIRGLLCSACNSALGMLADDPDRILRAAAYVRAALPDAITAERAADPAA